MILLRQILIVAGVLFALLAAVLTFLPFDLHLKYRRKDNHDRLGLSIGLSFLPFSIKFGDYGPGSPKKEGEPPEEPYEGMKNMEKMNRVKNMKNRNNPENMMDMVDRENEGNGEYEAGGKEEEGEDGGESVESPLWIIDDIEKIYEKFRNRFGSLRVGDDNPPAKKGKDYVKRTLQRILARSICKPGCSCRWLDIRIRFGLGTPMSTALGTGTLWTALSYLIGRVFGCLRMGKRENLNIRVNPDFSERRFEVEVDCIFRLFIGYIILRELSNMLYSSIRRGVKAVAGASD